MGNIFDRVGREDYIPQSAPPQVSTGRDPATNIFHRLEEENRKPNIFDRLSGGEDRAGAVRAPQTETERARLALEIAEKGAPPERQPGPLESTNPFAGLHADDRAALEAMDRIDQAAAAYEETLELEFFESQGQPPPDLELEPGPLESVNPYARMNVPQEPKPSVEFIPPYLTPREQGPLERTNPFARLLDKRAPSSHFPTKPLQRPWTREEIAAETEGLVEPLADPALAFTAGAGVGAKLGLTAARKLGKEALQEMGTSTAAIMAKRAGAVGASTIPTEYALIGPISGELEGNHPEAAFVASIAAGLASGVSLEILIEKGLMGVFVQAARKVPGFTAQEVSKLPEDVIKRMKAIGENEPWSEAIAEQERVKAERIRRRRGAAAGRRQTLKTQEPEIASRSGGELLENIVGRNVTPVIPSRTIEPRPSSMFRPRETLTNVQRQAAMRDLERTEEQAQRATRATRFNTWIALTGGVNPQDATFKGELKAITTGLKAGAKARAKGFPPGFFNNNARSIDERVTDAIEDGWLPRNATEQDFMDAIEADAAGRAVRRISEVEAEAEEGFVDAYRRQMEEDYGEDWEEAAENAIQIQVKESPGQLTFPFEPMREQPAGIQDYQKVVAKTTGRLVGTMKNIESAFDVASLMAQIRKEPQEVFYSIAVDAKGTPLEVHQFAKGTETGTPIPESYVVGRAFNVPGTKKLWLVHQHPSGVPEPSAEDYGMIEAISNLLKAGDIEASAVNIGRGKYTGYDEYGTSLTGDMPAGIRNIPFAVKGRRFAKLGAGPSVNSATKAGEIIARDYGNQDGVLLLSNKLNTLTFVPFGGPGGALKPMRDTTREILQAAERVNASAMIIKTDSDARPRMKYIGAIKKRFTNITLMDIIIKGESHSEAGLLRHRGTDLPDYETLTSTELHLHPSTITGPLGGLAAGVDWQALEERGEIKIDPKKALYGALAGVAGGAGIRPGRKLAGRIAKTWDEKFASPFVEAARSKANKMIVNEELRKGLGLNRSEELKDMLRDYKRDTEKLWEDAAKIGQELEEVAPTAVEQKRLMQIIEGGITTNPAMREKAAKVTRLFNQLRETLKKSDLLDYSRFDKLTRAERAELRKIANGPDPSKIAGEEFQEKPSAIDLKKVYTSKDFPSVGDFASGKARVDPATGNVFTREGRTSKIKTIETLADYAKNLGIEIPKEGLTRKQLIDKINAEIAFAKSRLDDYYRVGSAHEYAPIYYARKEGLTPEQRKILQEEIELLKAKSRRANAEGSLELDDLVKELEQMTRSNVQRADKAYDATEVNKRIGSLKKEIQRLKARSGGTAEGDPELERTIAELERIAGRGAEARKQQRITRAALVKSYGHRRLEIPIAVQRVMGLIEEAPYPVAKGIGVQQTDIRKQRLFQEVSRTPGWTMPYRRKGDIPANYQLVEDERFGALNGKAVRSDIWEDLKEVEDWRGAFVRNWDKYLGWWKFGKVVLNPSTHFRNAYSNMILAYLGDVNPTDLKTYGKAARAIKQGEENASFKEAADWGLFNNTFYSAEINKLRNELDQVRDPQRLRGWMRKAFSLPAELYQGNEKFFKMAVFIKARESGMSVDQAARKAEKHLFNYGDIPPWVKHMKRWVSPFFTFTYKALPLAAEMAIRKPWKMASIVGSMYGMEAISRHALGLTEEEAAAERESLAPWQQRKLFVWAGPYTQILMPFRDPWGNDLYFDFSYILPYGNLAEKWGQSNIPLSDLLPSNPLFTISAEILSNREAFTGRPIYNEVLDGGAEIAYKYADLAWREMLPSMAPGGYGFNKMKTGFENIFKDKPVLDWADRPITFQNAMLSALFGIKLTPANQEKLKAFEAKTRARVGRAIGSEIGKLKSKLKRNEIDQAEYESESRELMELKRKLSVE